MTASENDISPEPGTPPGSSDTNKLFPVFLKLEKLRLLIVGGGYVGLEKLTAVLNNAPDTEIKLVAFCISEAIKQQAAACPNITLAEKYYEAADIQDADIVIAAVDDPVVSRQIWADAKAAGVLINVADKPDLCDFYLGSIVQKGNLKIAISTNGKSPTIAKRLKEYLNESIPADTDTLLHNMQQIRGQLGGDLTERITRLNEITSSLAYQNDADRNQKNARRWLKVAYFCLFAFLFLFLGNLIASYITIREVGEKVVFYGSRIDTKFYWMILAGFLAQLVDGALGMGYGVTCTTVLLAIGVPLPAISGSIHTAEMFSSGASGFSHYKFGNVNKKLFKMILIPGILGAVAGAYLLSVLGEKYAGVIKPVLATYTLFLGARIIFNAFKKKTRSKKVRRVGWLAGAGGFLDSFGGGGWGPLVTSTLISKGKTPRYVIGTVSITEFFVTLASALTFFTMIGISHWQVIAGLIIGGVAGAPLAARLSGRLPLKTMFIAVGSMVVLWSLNILVRALVG